MQSSEFQQKAIQLVQVTPQGKYELHPDAANFLKKIPKPISVISVAGLYRTGKSYLLNRILLNRNNGFGVGPTINPFTKGLWCWGAPLKGTTKNGQQVNILIVDSEGIGALDEDQNHDIKIFTLAILTSSIFIYNSVGSIDENALQNLSLVVNLTKNIQLDSQQNNEDEDPEDLAQYFPTFFWVVRDFSLQLINSEGENITPKDYLEMALAPQKGFSDDVEEKNRIRRLLSSFFKERECATLVRPLVNQQKLQHLYDCSFDDLRPEFVEQALSLRKRIFSNTKVKTFKGKHLDGTMYLSILNSYLSCINNGAVPNIENAWTYMCMEKCLKLQEQCYDFFNEELEKNIKCNLPCPTDIFESQIQAIESSCYEMFEKEEIGHESKQYFGQLKIKIHQKILLTRLQNERESINVLKNYIMKNFTVIEKKMRMNEYQNFQDFLKSINNFYHHLIENGPDLPKKEIAYLDFLKKVITQGAEVFLRQTNQKLQTLKTISSEKELLLTTENEDLRKILKGEIQRFSDELNQISTEKAQLERKNQNLEHSLSQTIFSYQNRLKQLQIETEDKVKGFEAKIFQLSTTNNQLKEKKSSLESAFMVEKKERETEKALMDLKISQVKEELKSMKIKQKNQELQLSDMNYEYSTKLKEITLNHEKREKQLFLELNNLREKHQEMLERKDLLQTQIQTMDKTYKQNLKFIQEELKRKTSAFESYKLDFENDQLVKIKILQEENSVLKFEQSLLIDNKIEYEKLTKEANDKLKTISNEYETQIAIISQQNDFLQQQLSDLKQNYTKNVNCYESLLNSKNEAREEELSQLYKSQMEELTQKFTQKLTGLQNENSLLKQKILTFTNALNDLELKSKFESQVLVNKYQTELKNKDFVIKDIEEGKCKLLAQNEESTRILQQGFKVKQTFFQSKIQQLEEELQLMMEKASYEQEQSNIKSEESLKQLKNYYELEKEKLERKISLEKDKFQKKIDKLRDDYQNQLEEERRSYEQEFETLKDEFNNQTILLKDLVDSLQHENDSKTRNLQITEKQLSEEKEKMEKREIEFNSRFEALIVTHKKEQQSLQLKISELNERRVQNERQMMTVQHQKAENIRQLKELTSKYSERVEEKFNLNKKIEKIQNESRQKISDLTAEYMNQKLNYEKKIALIEQQKQFYLKKLEQFESGQNKTTVYLQEKMKKLKNDFAEQHKELQSRKNSECTLLESKYQKIKKSAKQAEQQMMRTITNLEKERAIEQEKYLNLHAKYLQFEENKSVENDQMSNQLSQLKQTLAKVTKQSGEEISKLKSDLYDLENQKNQISSSYQKSKILTANKIVFLQESKEKNKKEHFDKIRQLELTIENLQKTRTNEKSYYQGLINENVSKIERKYQTIIQQSNESWFKKEKQLESNSKKLLSEVRALTQKNILESQIQEQTIKTLERRIKDLQQGEKKAQNQLSKYKQNRQSMNSDNISLFSKERETMKAKLQDKEERYKKLQNGKQQLYYDFEKEKAKWNLEKEHFAMKNEELKQVISKNERDLEKLTRENEKLKAEKKCSKMANISGFSKYSYEKASSKFNLEDSINSINMSMSKENSNPLGEISFFNN